MVRRSRSLNNSEECVSRTPGKTDRMRGQLAGTFADIRQRDQQFIHVEIEPRILSAGFIKNK